MSNLQHKIESLGKSPVFALTKGNNELSHSNFWAWLIKEIAVKDGNGNLIHPFVELFIEDFNTNGYTFLDVTREEKNRDLTIYYSEKGDEKALVIENKLKAIPSAKHLEDYKKSIEENTDIDFAGGILTGITETLVGGQGWSFVSYETIATKMKEIKDAYKNEMLSYAEIIDQYIEDITNICYVINEKLNKNSDLYTWKLDENVEDVALERVKLADLLKKQYGCKFGKEIVERIATEDLESKWGPPEVDISYNHKKPTITVIYRKYYKEEKEDCRLGVQVEGNQFRIYGGKSTDKKLNKKEINDMYLFLKEKRWLSDYKDKKISGYKSSMRQKYCKYSTASYTHIYQYWDIDERYKGECKRKELTEEIIEKLKNAKDMIDNGFDFQ